MKNRNPERHNTPFPLRIQARHGSPGTPQTLRREHSTLCPKKQNTVKERSTHGRSPQRNIRGLHRSISPAYENRNLCRHSSWQNSENKMRNHIISRIQRRQNMVQLKLGLRVRMERSTVILLERVRMHNGHPAHHMDMGIKDQYPHISQKDREEQHL